MRATTWLSASAIASGVRWRARRPRQSGERLDIGPRAAGCLDNNEVAAIFALEPRPC